MNANRSAPPLRPSIPPLFILLLLAAQPASTFLNPLPPNGRRSLFASTLSSSASPSSPRVPSSFPATSEPDEYEEVEVDALDPEDFHRTEWKVGTLPLSANKAADIVTTWVRLLPPDGDSSKFGQGSSFVLPLLLAHLFCRICQNVH